MKVEVLKKVSPRICYAEDMLDGQIGIVNRTDKETWFGHRLFKINGGAVVSLDNPSCTWMDGCPIEVEVLPPGTQIMLTTEV